jgi:hypothetical protein
MHRHAPARLLTAVLAPVLALGLALSAAPAQAADTTTPDAYAPQTGALFNDPLGGFAEQRRLFIHVRRSISSVPAGGAIRIAVMSFADKRIADALVAAYQRGVRVKLIFAGADVYPPMQRMKDVLGSDVTARSFAITCDRSCRGTGGEMHAKYFSFSRTSGGSQYVTMVGSNNLTEHNATEQWSDLYTVEGDQRYYRAYNDWFRQLKHDTPVEKQYLRKFVGKNQISITPIDLSSTDDPIRTAFSRVRCEVTRGELDPEAENPDEVVHTRIRIGAHAWNGERGKTIARDVSQLTQQGCLTQVFYGVGTGPAVRAILTQGGAQLTNGTHKGIYTHEKMMVIKGAYGHHLDTVRVWTGSHNWSDRSPGRDDLILYTKDEAIGADYIAGFKYMWRNG